LIQLLEAIRSRSGGRVTPFGLQEGKTRFQRLDASQVKANLANFGWDWQIVQNQMGFKATGKSAASCGAQSNGDAILPLGISQALMDSHNTKMDPLNREMGPSSSEGTRQAGHSSRAFKQGIEPAKQ